MSNGQLSATLRDMAQQHQVLAKRNTCHLRSCMHL